MKWFKPLILNWYAITTYVVGAYYCIFVAIYFVANLIYVAHSFLLHV